MLKKLFLITAAAIGGIYLTSEEGKQARVALMQKKSTFEPVVKDLLHQAQEVLDGSRNINSNEIRANINLLIKEAKMSLIDLDFDKTVATVREAIAVASKKISEANNELEETQKTAKKAPAASKSKGL